MAYTVRGDGTLSDMDEDRREPDDEDLANVLGAFQQLGDTPEDRHLAEARKTLGQIDELNALERDRLALALSDGYWSRLSELEARAAEAETDPTARPASRTDSGPSHL